METTEQLSSIKEICTMLSSHHCMYFSEEPVLNTILGKLYQPEQTTEGLIMITAKKVTFSYYISALFIEKFQDYFVLRIILISKRKMAAASATSGAGPPAHCQVPSFVSSL